MCNSGRAIETAGRHSDAALNKELYLAFKPTACALWAFGFLPALDEAFKTVIALFTYVFKDRHFSPRGHCDRGGGTAGHRGLNWLSLRCNEPLSCLSVLKRK